MATLADASGYRSIVVTAAIAIVVPIDPVS
jgi:hypothetical protein